MNPLRERSTRRAKDHIALANNKVPDHLVKSPSQKKSESLRKKLARGVKDPRDSAMDDCRGCTRYPCGHGLSTCDLMSLVKRCGKCGQKVRYRVIAGVDWKYCPSCRENEQ